MASTNVGNIGSGDRRRREWEKVCAEVARAHQRLKRIEGQVTWLIAYFRGLLPSNPLTDQQDCLSGE